MARLNGAARVLASLNPDNVLARGYVRVTGVGGKTLVSRATAAGEAALTLHFRDGVLGVMPEDGAAIPPARPAQTRPAQTRPAPLRKPAAEQGDLF